MVTTSDEPPRRCLSGAAYAVAVTAVIAVGVLLAAWFPPCGPQVEAGLMAAGLQALYEFRQPPASANYFHRVLECNPNHYGANLQLAKALDLEAKRNEARRQWLRVLELAEAAGDTDTVRMAQTGLNQ